MAKPKSTKKSTIKKSPTQKKSPKKSTSSKNEFISDTKAFDNYGKAWNLTTKNFLPLIAVIIIISALDILRGSLDNINTTMSWISTLIIFLIIIPIGMSTSWVFLKAARKEKFIIADIFSVFKRNYLNAVITGILMTIFVVVGLILFIIPGIIIFIRLSFVSYLVIDKKMEAIKALQTSWNMTKGHSWTIFGMILLAIPIVIAGLIVLIVGVLFSVAWISAAFAILYHSVSLGKKK